MSDMEKSRIVAVEPDEKGECAEIFRRLSDGSVATELVGWHPMLLVAGENIADSLPGVVERRSLSGAGSLNCQLFFESLKAYKDAQAEIKRLTGYNASSPLAPYRVFSDLQFQILAAREMRLFDGMEFGDLRRMQLDIETRTSVPGEFCNAMRAGDEVLLISLKDSTGWEVCLSLAGRNEGELLREMVEVIQQRDPDVIEGHNIFNFDLDYLEKRCKRHKVPFAIGRRQRGGDFALAKGRPSQFSAGDRMVKYRRYDVYGRHVVDTYFLTMLYDVSKRDMESHGLKATAKYFGVASEARTYVEGAKITDVYDNDPDTLMAYCLDDVRETDAISRIMSPSWFYQTRQVPVSYQNCVVRGNASRVDLMMCAEYLAAGASLPTPMAARAYAGALAGAERTGLFHKVWHIDVRSLYPSVILANELQPRSDHLGKFLLLLAKLRDFRLQAKDAMRQAETPERKEYFQALQASFKILINSFYGYLGFGQATFNDFDMAEIVTEKGRAILSSMREFLESNGAQVIEMDTDGLYFAPPAGFEDTQEMRRRVQEILPEGIEVELDATYAAMLSYKAKNYALLDERGKVHLTGAALRSRGMEPYLRRFISEYMEIVLNGRSGELDGLYERYCSDVENHRLPLKDLCKRENLSTDPDTYAAKVKSGAAKRSAPYELALAAGNDRFKTGNSVFYYVTGNKKSVSVVDNSRLLDETAQDSVRDENIPYYLDKLKQLFDKFKI